MFNNITDRPLDPPEIENLPDENEDDAYENYLYHLERKKYREE